MSRDFIGSKISIITKSQCRYTGTIIGIDAQTSSIVLGNIKCYGVESRSGHSTNGHLPGSTLPIMQFANSEIEDLKIVDDEQIEESFEQAKTQPSFGNSAAPSSVSIHDDPAIVSAVMGSTNLENNTSSRLINNLQQLTLNDQQSKSDESRIHSNVASSWSALVQTNNNANFKGSSDQQSAFKTKFFDSFALDKSNNSNNKNLKRSSNTHSTQTFRDNTDQYDDHGFRVRQPFFSDDQPSYPPRQYQQNRNQNGNHQYQKPNFYNNHRPHISNYQRRNGNYNNNNSQAGGNRETFQSNPNDYAADFDFETNNQKFNKITNIDGDDDDNQLTIAQLKTPIDPTGEYPLLYDKKKSFFDNLTKNENNDLNNRSKNQDTFGQDGFYQRNNRSNNNGYRRNNKNYRQGNNDFNSRQANNNGYYYRY